MENVEDKLERLRIFEEKQKKATECLRKSKQRPEYKEVIRRSSATYYERHKEELSIKNKLKYKERINGKQLSCICSYIWNTEFKNDYSNCLPEF